MTEDDLIREIRAKRAEASSAPLEALRVFARAIGAAFDGGLVAEVVRLATDYAVTRDGWERVEVVQVHIRGRRGEPMLLPRVQVGPRGARIEGPQGGEGAPDLWGAWLADPEQLLIALALRVSLDTVRTLETMAG